MKKLTIEQRDWLIELIREEAIKQCFGEDGTLTYAQVVMKILNQCTEQTDDKS